MPVDWSFNANSVAPSQGFDSLAPGKYQVYISNTSLDKDKNGKDMFVVEYTVFGMGAPNDGVKAFDRFNLFNDNETARRIAHQELSALCHCVGIFDVSLRDDGAALRNGRLVIEMAQQKGREGTEVRTRFDLNGNAPGKKGGASAPATGQAPAPAQQQAAPPPAQAAPQSWGPGGQATQGAAYTGPDTPPAQAWAPPGPPAAAAPAQAAPAGGPPANWQAPAGAPPAPPQGGAPAWAPPANPGAGPPAGGQWQPPR